MKKNKNLIFIFLGLMAILLFSRIYNSPKTRSFDKELIAIDTSDVTSVVIKPKAEENEISLSRKEAWAVTMEGQSYRASKSMVESVFKLLRSIEVMRLVSRSNDQWKDFEVTDSAGTRVQVFIKDKKVSDFIVGRFSFNQQTRSALSYIRLYDSDDVYAIDGFLSLTFNQAFDSFIDKQLLNLTSSDFAGLEYEIANISHRLRIDESGQWTANGIALDSTEVAAYLASMSNVRGVDIAPETAPSSPLVSTLSIMTDQQAFTLSAHSSAGDPNEYFINSSYNPGIWFSSDSTGIYKTIFGDLNNLLD